jgi:hypothetical protein
MNHPPLRDDIAHLHLREVKLFDCPNKRLLFLVCDELRFVDEALWQLRLDRKQLDLRHITFAQKLSKNLIFARFAREPLSPCAIASTAGQAGRELTALKRFFLCMDLSPRILAQTR